MSMRIDPRLPLGSPKETRLLEKLLGRWRSKLARQCIAAATDLFDEKPGSATRTLARKARHRFEAAKDVAPGR